MSVNLVKNSYAPLAKGPLAKPDGMIRPVLGSIKKLSLPVAVVCFSILGSGFVFLHQWRVKKYNNYISNLNPDALFEEIKEYGVLKSAKASWQE